MMIDEMTVTMENDTFILEDPIQLRKGRYFDIIF